MAIAAFDEEDPFSFDDPDIAPPGYGNSSSSSSAQPTGGSSRIATAPSSSPVNNTIEQHALHSIFADGAASEVPWNVCVELSRGQMSSRIHFTFLVA